MRGLQTVDAMFFLDPEILTPLIARALDEDRGHGDLTTLATVEPQLFALAEVIAKQELVLAGWPVAVLTFLRVSPEIRIETNVSEGTRVANGELLAKLRGPAASLLTAERVALNFLQRLSGIATLTRRFVEAVAGTKAQILDTRKTTPGLRILEKYAVRVGGGRNHRFGLYDGVLIKDNHIVAAGGISQALARVRSGVDHLKRIEVEVTNFDELEEALRAGADVVLLDNMTVEEVSRSVELNRARALLEVSGGISLENVRQYALAGVDLISVGALTHSAAASDISMRLRL